MTLLAYFTKLKALWDELEVCRTPFTCNQRQIHVDQRNEDKFTCNKRQIHVDLTY